MLPFALIAALLTAWAVPSRTAARDGVGLAGELQAIAARTGGHVGFAALHLPSGRAVGLHEHEAFPTQSVFKLPIAITVLHAIDRGAHALDQVVTLDAGDARAGAARTIAVPSRHSVRRLIEAMIIDSDNTACDKLLALVGGPLAVDARMRAIGIKGISIRFTEQEMGAGKVDNNATPAAMIALLAKLARGQADLGPASAKLLDDMLVRVVTGPRRLKGNLPPGTVVAHKTGMSGTRDGITDATNDVGLITLPDGSRLAVAAFIHASPADLAAREETIARLARLVFDAVQAR